MSAQRTVTHEGCVADRELVRLVGEGNVTALGELYDRHSSVLFSLALRIVRERAAAEDAVHEAFVTAAEHARQYLPERGTVLSWLTILVRNASTNRKRRLERSQTSATCDLPLAVNAKLLVADADAAERIKIRRALATLPAEARMILEWLFFLGLTYSEIATSQDIPLAIVRSRAALGLRLLPEALARSKRT